jgi:16S rRNA (uracil1498-N3)-methyltransferase
VSEPRERGGTATRSTRGTVRVPLADLEPGERALEPEAARYLVRVLRLGPGDGFVAFDPAARREAEGVLTAVGGGRVRALLRAPRPATRVARREVTLVQTLSKGGKMDAVVRDATELGATRIVPAVAERSVRRPERPHSLTKRLERVVLQAARQCGRGDVPAIEPPLALGSALAAHAPARSRALGLCLHPEAEIAFAEALAPGAAAVVLVVGPEGGLADAELALARAAGFTLVRLGDFVLRTETAATAALAAVAAWLPAVTKS